MISCSLNQWAHARAQHSHVRPAPFGDSSPGLSGLFPGLVSEAPVEGQRNVLLWVRSQRSAASPALSPPGSSSIFGAAASEGFKIRPSCVCIAHVAFLARTPKPAQRAGRLPGASQGRPGVGGRRGRAQGPPSAQPLGMWSSSALKTPLSSHLGGWERPWFPQKENPGSRRDASRERTCPAARQEGRPGGGHACI